MCKVIRLSYDSQGEVHTYGSHADLAERKIDTVQLLGLIQEKKSDERDEFVYKDDESDDEGIAKLMLQSSLALV